MCSILCWILSIWEALGWIFWIFGLIHALSTRGRSLSMFWATECIKKVFRWFRAISGLCCTLVWPVRVLALFTCCALVWPVVSTGQSWADEWLACIHPGGVALVQGELACVQGQLFVIFELWFGGLPSLLEYSFVSDVSSRCPCLRGSRLVFFKWSCSLPFFGFRSLVGVSFHLFLFFFFTLGLLYVCVVNALIKGEIEDHVWFEDRWMVAYWLLYVCVVNALNVVWTDSWLSIADGGCGLTSVGACEEQARGGK
jgi:hypothetical protein